MTLKFVIKRTLIRHSPMIAPGTVKLLTCFNADSGSKRRVTITFANMEDAALQEIPLCLLLDYTVLLRFPQVEVQRRKQWCIHEGRDDSERTEAPSPVDVVTGILGRLRSNECHNNVR